MSMIVKGMEMPKNCAGCPICCGLPYQHRDEKGRRPDCPLVEISTPHGRLIDLDKFKSDYGMNDECAKCDKELRGSVRECETNFSYRKMDFCGWLDDADTVIEAEGSET